jgi:hypothetical protein
MMVVNPLFHHPDGEERRRSFANDEKKRTGNGDCPVRRQSICGHKWNNYALRLITVAVQANNEVVENCPGTGTIQLGYPVCC